MTEKKIHIIPYTDDKEVELLQMEKGIVQGTYIQLELLKNHFLDRARVFEKYYSNYAITNENEVIGAAIGSKSKLIIDGVSFNAGFGFDAKVIAAMRKKGIGKMLIKDLYKCFFAPSELTKCFMTAKLSNVPILKLVSRALDKVWLYEFNYLTVPTSAIIPIKAKSKKKQLFSIHLFNNEMTKSEYYTLKKSGLGYFHTWKMYKLRIKKINWFYQSVISFLKKIYPGRYSNIPDKDEIISFATLFNHTSDNIHLLNEILEDLKNKEIKYLQVCCQKNDTIYRYLKNSSINTYKYYLVSDFSLKNKQSVTLDVRCL